uniref:Glycophorin-A n=1 Tax=Strongyloides venezuelensis TaxID=75913 RepID=A0A0K0EW30_STRVS
MKKAIKWKLFVVLLLLTIQFQCYDAAQSSSSDQEMDNKNNVNGTINGVARIDANERNVNYMEKNIGAALTEFHIVIIVFASIASSMLIIGGIMFAVYRMHKAKIISRKVLTGEETQSVITRKGRGTRNSRTRPSRT